MSDRDSRIVLAKETMAPIATDAARIHRRAARKWAQLASTAAWVILASGSNAVAARARTGLRSITSAWCRSASDGEGSTMRDAARPRSANDDPGTKRTSALIDDGPQHGRGTEERAAGALPASSPLSAAEMLLRWSSTLSDWQLLSMRNFGQVSLAWVRKAAEEHHAHRYECSCGRSVSRDSLASVRGWIAAIGSTNLATGRRATKADALLAIDAALGDKP